MSAPLPFTVKVEPLIVREPAWPGEPMSAPVQVFPGAAWEARGSSKTLSNTAAEVEVSVWAVTARPQTAFVGMSAMVVALPCCTQVTPSSLRNEV